MIEFEFRWTDPNGDITIFKTESIKRLKDTVEQTESYLSDWVADVTID